MFVSALPMWLDAGGVYALANLRGGGEYGEAWHRAGMLGNKQNVFDDFLSAAEWLIDQGITTSDRLAITGGSNGGLLVGAALTQRPDLFKAVVCQVPLLDMLRYQNLSIARLWIPEYGSAEDAEQFRWLYAYSPYHHVRAGRGATRRRSCSPPTATVGWTRCTRARWRPACRRRALVLRRCCCEWRPPPATARASPGASSWRKPPTSGAFFAGSWTSRSESVQPRAVGCALGHRRQHRAAVGGVGGQQHAL